MRKRILLLSLLLPILFFGSFVLAQEEAGDETTTTLEQETADISSTLPNPGLTPDHPLYFLDTLGENIGLFLTRSPEGKAEKAFSYAEEKLGIILPRHRPQPRALPSGQNHNLPIVCHSAISPVSLIDFQTPYPTGHKKEKF